MANSRYWRLVGFRTRGGGDLELSALHLYDASGRADAASPPVCTASPVDGSTSNLADGDLATVARYAAKDAASPGFAFDWDFGAGGKDIIYPRLGAGAVAARFPQSMLLLRSSDTRTWEVANRFEQYIYPGNSQMTLEPVPGALVVDSFQDAVVVDLRFDGSVGSGIIVDETGRAWTSQGGVLSMGASLDGTPSLSVGSTLGISTPASASLNLGLGDVTAEAWVYQTSRTGGTFLFGNYYQNVIGQAVIGLIGDASFNLSFASGCPTAAFYTSNDLSGITAANPIPLNTWVHLALVKMGSAVTLFVGGQPVGSTAFSGPVNSSTRTLAVGMDSAYGAVFQGFVGRVGVTKGARYTAAFTPTTSPYSSGILEKPSLNMGLIHYSGMAGAPTASAAVWMPIHHGILRDMEYSGCGCIASTVMRKNMPANTPLRRRVRLIHERSGLPIRETWSDPVTGTYRFEYIDEKETYTVVSYDHLRNYRAVIADNLTLANGGVELMP